jgi:hypothetical protein
MVWTEVHHVPLQKNDGKFMSDKKKSYASNENHLPGIF